MEIDLVFVIIRDHEQFLSRNDTFTATLNIENLSFQSNVDQTPLTRDRVRNMVRDIFAAASERDIYTGDEVEISVIDANGIETQRFPLRSD